MPESINEAYFHEDDYCQQEILPLGALEFCRQQIDQIDEFAAAHKAPEGVGWTEMFIRKDSPEKLVDVQIPLTSFRNTMSEHLAEVPVIYTGYSSHREHCKNTVGFALNPDCMIFAEWNELSVVNSIWTRFFSPHPHELKQAVKPLQGLGRVYPLLYVDWAWSFATPLDQSPALEERLISKVSEISRRMEQKD